MRKHLGLSSYPCPVMGCNSKFTEKANCFKHLLTLHVRLNNFSEIRFVFFRIHQRKESSEWFSRASWFSRERAYKLKFQRFWAQSKRLNTFKLDKFKRFGLIRIHIIELGKFIASDDDILKWFWHLLDTYCLAGIGIEY